LRLRPTRSPRRRVALALAALMSLPAIGAAQVDALPSGVVRAASIGPSEQTQIDAYVAKYAPGLTSGDPDEMRRSRDLLLSPLKGEGFTFAFRRAYGGALWPTIESLVASDNPFEQLAGMRLAGRVATEQPTGALINLLESEDAGVRVFAAGRLGLVLETAISSSTPTISPDTAARAVRGLAERVRADEEIRVADASVRSLGEATGASPRALDGVRDIATRELGDAIGDRLRAARERLSQGQEEMLVALRALGLVRIAVADANARPSAETAKAAVGAGGDAIAYILARFDADLIGEDKSVEVRLLQAAQTTFYFGRQRYAEVTNGDRNIPTPTLDKAFEGPRPRDFRIQATGLLGPSATWLGELGFKPDRFIGS